MVRYLCNAFSLSMLSRFRRAVVEVSEVDVYEFCDDAKISVSAVGHEQTAMMLMQICNYPVRVNRTQIHLNPGDELLVMQVLERLPEGRVLSNTELTELLDKGKIKFYKVRLISSEH